MDAFVPLTVNEEFIERYPGSLGLSRSHFNDLPKSLGLSRSHFVELLGLSNCWVEKQQQKWATVYKNWGLTNYLDVDQSTQEAGGKFAG